MNMKDYVELLLYDIFGVEISRFLFIRNTTKDYDEIFVFKSVIQLYIINYLNICWKTFLDPSTEGVNLKIKWDMCLKPP